MTAMPGPGKHHAYAAKHHAQAAKFHREAIRHYQIGKDYAHAAHQALMAHGHALHARMHGEAAGAYYAAHEGSPLPKYLNRSSTASKAVALPVSLSGIELHFIAADHHDAAEQHHAQAGKHCDAEHFVRANHATKAALDHGKHGLFHGEQAAMHHAEHYGAQPLAELV